MDYIKVEFERIGGGRTVEYRTADHPARTLAYFDQQGSLFAAEVFDPFTGKRRYYAPRKHVRAYGIVHRHLEALGYTNPVEAS